MLPVLDTTPSTYVCAITYSDPGTSGANIANYTFSPALPAAGVNFHNLINFTFSYTGSATNVDVNMHKAVLIAGFKGDTSNPEKSSPFAHDANCMQLQSTPSVTIGSRAGTWGFTVSFSVIFSSTATNTSNTHFYFLPDPQIVVKPE